MAREWTFDRDQLIHDDEAGNWLEYGRFGEDTYALHTTVDGEEVALRIDCTIDEKPTEKADELLDRIASGWRAVNW